MPTMPTPPLGISTLLIPLMVSLACCVHVLPGAERVTFTGLTVPVSVSDDSNVERENAPVSGGIPFPRGALSEAMLPRLVLADRRSRSVDSLQTPVVLGRWGDGSIKWLLLDFLADLPANGTAEFTLGIVDRPRGDNRRGSRNGIVVTASPNAFTVDTGKLKAVIDRKAFSFIQQAWVDANGDGRYAASEQVVDGPGEMFIDLDDAPPGPADAGAYDYPDEWYFGMEGGNWLRSSQAGGVDRYLASAGDYSVELYREGSTHTVFKLEGWHRGPDGRQFGKYSLYLHFYAQQDYVRASHTWIMTGDPDQDFIRSMGIKLPIALDGDRLDYAFGGPFELAQKPIVLNPSIDTIPFVPIQEEASEVISGQVAASGEAYLLSIGPDKYYHNVPANYDQRVEYEVVVDGAGVDQGFHPSGWADVSNGSLGISVGVRDFWREHPKQVRYRDGKLAAFIWPEDGGKTLDLRRRYPEIRGPGPKRGGDMGKAARREFVLPGSAVGLAKTTDLFFKFHAGNHRVGQVDRDFRGFQDPLRPFAAAEWSCATGVFGPIAPYDPEGSARMENFIDLSFAWPLRSAEEFNWYGMLDYGDHLLEYESIAWELSVPGNPGHFQNWGYSGWMQEAYRTGQWMFVQYLRSGRHRYWREAETWLRHHRDVDCVFWDTPDNGPRPQDNRGGNRLGGGHRHDQQHWGAYLTSYGIPAIAVTHHYYLTGDGRSLDAMRDFSTWLLDHSRIENQGVLAVLYMAEALGDQDLIDRALAKTVEPGIGYGRLIFHSGMGLMLHDIQTGGDERVRTRLEAWADLDDPSATFIRAYLASQGATRYRDRLRQDLAAIFPEKSVRSQYFAWAKRKPTDFRDAFSADIMPPGTVWKLPLRTLEKLVFDAPFGMGNNTARNQMVSQLIWLMGAASAD